ncbi:MAG: 16S rRNA (guanine(527)-N(7))-methyltransferase RsmG [Anaerolineae bacterium]|nr:16S rRNA (guanine(527)-N(7))-methyltransferase RsmG [Anaerolineae bacterium]
MELLVEEARRLGLTLDPRRVAMFERYYRELASWNQRFNLTAVTEYRQVQLRHFLDSLTCLLAIPQREDRPRESLKLGLTIPDTVPLQRGAEPLWIIDIGSGAGFPGLPLKIMMPEAKVTLVESIGKKVTFLRHMIEVLELERIEVLAMRAETAGQLPEHRERYDMVVARAVAHLATLAEYCLPFCRIGGRMVLPKGADASSEVFDSQTALKALGGVSLAIKPISIPEIDTERYLVIVEKVAKTPDAYPRREGIPSKRPL